MHTFNTSTMYKFKPGRSVPTGNEYGASGFYAGKGYFPINIRAARHDDTLYDVMFMNEDGCPQTALSSDLEPVIEERYE